MVLAGTVFRLLICDPSPDVEFCAYAIPHPSEPKMNVRIQTFDSTTAVEALEKGLRDLQELCDVVTDQFVVAREKFMAK
jgi:DNA-directed RNA polymerase I and III subunit RPAC2